MRGAMSKDAEVSFVVGEKFHSFQELQDKILRIKKATGVEFWESGARTISSAPKSHVKSFSADLVYYQIRYSCLHSSRKRKMITADGYTMPV